MLKQLLKNNITFTNRILTWQDSLDMAAKPLLDKNLIQHAYIDSIVSYINQKGFDIVISEDVAVPHVKDDSLVNQSCLSLLISSSGIAYGRHENIRLVFLFALKDKAKHLDILETLANFISNNDNLYHLLLAETEEDVLKLLS